MLQSLQPIIVQTFHVYAITFFFSTIPSPIPCLRFIPPFPRRERKRKKKIIIIKEIHPPPLFRKVSPSSLLQFQTIFKA